jgi:hypothetical protein
VLYYIPYEDDLQLYLTNHRVDYQTTKSGISFLTHGCCLGYKGESGYIYPVIYEVKFRASVEPFYYLKIGKLRATFSDKHGWLNFLAYVIPYTKIRIASLRYI